MSPQTDVQNSTERQSSVSCDKILLSISLAVRQKIPSLHRCGAADPICRDHKYECCSGGHIFLRAPESNLRRFGRQDNFWDKRVPDFPNPCCTRDSSLRPQVSASPRLSVEARRSFRKLAHARGDADQKVGGWLSTCDGIRDANNTPRWNGRRLDTGPILLSLKSAEAVRRYCVARNACIRAMHAGPGS